jgi:hypothetical protein
VLSLVTGNYLIDFSAVLAKKLAARKELAISEITGGYFWLF